MAKNEGKHKTTFHGCHKSYLMADIKSITLSDSGM